MNYTIRTCGWEDIDILTGIIRASFRDVADRFSLTPENCPRHPSNCIAEWVQGDMERGVTYYVLDDGDQALGCVAFEQANIGEFYLERLAVLPERRRCGLGRVLVEHVLAQARCVGNDCRVGIGIIAAQAELKEWYRRIGFAEGETKEFVHLPFLVTFLSYRIKGNISDGV